MHAPNGAAEWERLFWLVFSRTSNPIVLLDDRRRVLRANDSAMALFGRSREEVIGRSIEDSIRPSERAAARSDWARFLTSGQYSGSRHLVRPDGSEVEVDFAAQLATVGGRRVAIYVAMAGAGPARPGARRRPSADVPLSGREREVVTLISLGLETAQIAEQLHISPETVRTHVRNAMAKLGARTRAQLVAIALCREDAVHDEPLRA